MARCEDPLHPSKREIERSSRNGDADSIGAMTPAEQDLEGSNSQAGCLTDRRSPTLLHPVRSQDWEPYKDIIQRLFAHQSLAAVMKTLKEVYCFHATAKQYKTKLKQWGLYKNLSSKDMAAIVRVRDERMQEGKHTRFHLRGIPVPPEKIERWIKRNRTETESFGSSRPLNITTPPGLQYHTPSPASDSDAASSTASGIDEEWPEHGDAMTTICDSRCQKPEAETSVGYSKEIADFLVMHRSLIALLNEPSSLFSDNGSPMPNPVVHIHENGPKGSVSEPILESVSVDQERLWCEAYHGSLNENLGLSLLDIPDGAPQPSRDSTATPSSEGWVLADSTSTSQDMVGTGSTKRPSHHGIGELKYQDGPRNKRAKLDPLTQNFSCPYRKRNPLRFNVRDYQACSLQSFGSIISVKCVKYRSNGKVKTNSNRRHIRSFHKRVEHPYTCLRCREGFASRARLEAHLMRPAEEVCAISKLEAKLEDPEDGISSEAERYLVERKSGSKVDTWKCLWMLLFRRDEHIPSSDFEPPVEIHEIIGSLVSYREDLRQRVLSTATQLVPSCSPQMINTLVEKMNEVFGEFIKDKLCRREVGRGNSPRRPMGTPSDPESQGTALSTAVPRNLPRSTLSTNSETYMGIYPSSATPSSTPPLLTVSTPGDCNSQCLPELSSVHTHPYPNSAYSTSEDGRDFDPTAVRQTFSGLFPLPEPTLMSRSPNFQPLGSPGPSLALETASSPIGNLLPLGSMDFKSGSYEFNELQSAFPMLCSHGCKIPGCTEVFTEPCDLHRYLEHSVSHAPDGFLPISEE